MSRSAVRAQGPVTAATTTVGTPGTDEEVRTFSQDVRPCLVVNNFATDTVYVKMNATGASTVTWQVLVLPGATRDISLDGMINIKSVSLYTGAALPNYTGVLVLGWPA
jgi:hypothetical protein